MAKSPEETLLNIDTRNEVVFSASTGIVYEFEADAGKDPKTDFGTSKSFKDFELVKWGKKNNLPNEHVRIIYANENKPQIISNRIALTIGKGVFAYRIQLENGKESILPVQDQPEIQEFLDVANPFTLESYNDFAEQVLHDDEAFANPFCSVILNREGTKAVSVKSLDATTCRIGKHKTTGELALLIADWANTQKEVKEEDVKILPFFDPLEPTKYYEFALQLNQKISGQPFYSIVPWNGTKAWAEISALIPKFHLAGLKNGSYIRYHIKIPASYLLKYPEDQRNDIRYEIQKDMDNLLAGAENGHKTFTSYIEDIGGNATEWQIETIEGELKDDSYLKLDDHADKKQSRGHDMHPILSNIEIQGKLSSGSEILNLLNYHTAYKTQRQRERVLFPLKVIALINNWPKDIKFGFKDVEFTTTDKNPTGTQNAATV